MTIFVYVGFYVETLENEKIPWLNFVQYAGTGASWGYQLMKSY